jgi:biopolymer transport protein ExbD
MAAGSGGGAKSDINVTPLVDVCLVLLIIFMVMVPRNVPEISVRIPPESKVKRPPKDHNDTLVVGMTVDESGKVGLLLNRNPIEKGKLAEELTKQLESREKRVVFLDSADKVPYGEAVAIIDLAKGAGADVVGIMKDKAYKMPETLKGL